MSPLTLFITLVTLIVSLFVAEKRPKNSNGKRILISGGRMTKSLQLARSLYHEGHWIVLTDDYRFATHRFSRCVSRFRLSSDITDSSSYIDSIVRIVREEKIDVFIPVSNTCTERVEAQMKEILLENNCSVFHGDIEQLNMLSHKYLFIDYVRSLGLSAPKTFSITNAKQILDFDFRQEQRSFLLKSVIYNSAVRSHLVKLPCPTEEETKEYLNGLVIDEEHPWVMQEFISGKEYCTHSVLRDGQLRLHTCCQSSPYLLNYEHLNDQDQILQWVQQFCSKLNFTGQISFDFIQSDEDGLPYAIECNPRTHSAIVNFYNHPSVSEAYLGKEPLLNAPIQPRQDAKEVYWLHYELWNLFKSSSLEQFFQIIKRFLYGKEAIWSLTDPLPFLLHYTLHMPYVLIYTLYERKPFNFVDCNLGFAH